MGKGRGPAGTRAYAGTAMPDASTTSPATVEASLAGRLAGLTLLDEKRLRSRLQRARAQRDRGRRTRDLAAVAADIETAEVRVALRADARPDPIRYPSELPVSQRAEEIAAAIRDHQV